VDQLFGKIGRAGTRGEAALTGAFADSSLTGNGLNDQRLLQQDYTSVYTIPDQTDNRSYFANLTGKRDVTSTFSLSGNLYYRRIRANTFNADINDDSLDESAYQPSAAERTALAAAGYTGFPASGESAANTPFPQWRCIAEALLKTEPDEKCNGLLTHTNTTQHNFGASGQGTWTSMLGRGKNQLTAGGALDASRIDYTQASQFGYLNPDLTVTPVNAFADGTTNVDGTPFDTRVNLHGTPHTSSVYATDSWSPDGKWHASLSARYNRTIVDNLDRLLPAGGDGSLNGHYVFDRVNPSAGLTFAPSAALSAYVSYGEGSRAPTSIELGCADPNQPCKLPNALAGDPPLQQVVTRTWEAGARGAHGKAVTWNISAFRANNNNDILFLASEQTGFGYFKNFGQTRRQGVDASATIRISRVSLGGGYTFLDATYQSAETFDGSSNSTNATALAGGKGLEGTIEVVPGDRIPLVPRRMVKAFADYDATRSLSLDLDLVGVSSSYARGNENNQDQPDGTYYLGSGSSPGYVVVNAGAHFQIRKGIQVVAEVNNLFDRQYYTAAQLEATGITANKTFVARPFAAVNGDFPLLQATFLAPGAPRQAWVGLRVKF
ncbi:MAG TPA: TonB-dependent receptor, partial [Vicinamibacterales bacterium]|nr:TonB-dependent receptor [Vicinamibacterales bacterium]